jgi:uroporphyrinogen-III synthase
MAARSLAEVDARIAAVGPATAAALARAGRAPDVVPDDFRGVAVPDAMGELSGRRVLLPRADIAGPALPEALRRRGASVDEVVAYRTRPAAPDPAALAAIERGVDVVAFTSGSTARQLAARLADAGWAQPAGPLAGARIACIGPSTAEAAAAAGWPVHIVATEHTVDGLVAAVAEDLARAGSGAGHEPGDGLDRRASA